MELSVVIITWNSEKDVKPCIDAVLESTSHLVREIVVVDNGSRDATVDILKSFGNEIRLFRNQCNLGVAKARNRGLRKARGEFLWILDVDTLVNSDAVNGMLNHLKKDPDTGICGCKMISQIGEIQESCRKVPTLRHKLLNAFLLLISKMPGSFIFQRNSPKQQTYGAAIEKNVPFQVGYVIGACQMFPRNVLEKVGMLDEHIFYGPEDADFCLRTCQNGWKVMFLPQVSIIHYYQRMTSQKIFSQISWSHLKAVFYFSWKHKRF